MPKLNHSWRRDNGVYYFRMAIPTELKEAKIAFEIGKKKMGSEIKFSLGVSDYRSAASKIPLHAAIWREKFDASLKELAEARERRELKPLATSDVRPASTNPAPIVTDERIQAILFREFVRMQKDTAEAVEALRSADKEDKAEVLSDLGMEIRGYENDREGESGIVGILRRMLRAYGLESLPIESKEFQSLLSGYRAALTEDLYRRYFWIANGTPTERDPMFRGIHAGSTPPDATQGMTLAELKEAFSKAQTAKGVGEKNHRQSRSTFRALFEFFGDSMPIAKIDSLQITAFFDFLDTVETHTAQRFKGKTLREAASVASQKSEVRLMKPRTKNNYYQDVVKIFGYATDVEAISRNPAKIRSLQLRFKRVKKTERPPFTVDEMTAIFKAPLFTGCVDDARGFNKTGPNFPRRGRFWVNLLAMFNALRCNEACQLEIGDINTVEGVPCILVTDEPDDEEEDEGTQKFVKNETSKTTVPIHPILLKMGFLEFVQSRKLAGDGRRLFPELRKNPQGKYSDYFSKWFHRFFKRALNGKKTKAVFHSFRHSFRDAERRAQINTEISDRLGRWATSSSVGQNYGHGFPMPLLRDELAKVDYPGVDLSHLLPKPQRIRTPVHIAPGYPRA